jgi:hypothetical protein
LKKELQGKFGAGKELGEGDTEQENRGKTKNGKKR